MASKKQLSTMALLDAVNETSIEAVRAAIAAGADVNYDEGQPLAAAISANFEEGVAVLIAAGANPTARDGDLLIDAASPFSGKTPRRLVENMLDGGNFEQDDKDYAAVVATLEKQGGALAALSPHVNIAVVNAEADLIKAAAAHSPGRIDAAFDKGARSTSRAAARALIEAAGNLDALRAMLRHGVDANTTAGGRSLRVAARAGCSESIDALRWAFAPMESLDAERLIMAAEDGRDDMVIFMISMMTKIHHGDLLSALVGAAGNGHLNVIRVFLSSGFTFPDLLFSAMKRASGHGHFLVVDELLNAGADPREDDYSAFFRAAMKGHASIVRRLAKAAMPPIETLYRLANVADSMQHPETAGVVRALIDSVPPKI